MSEVKPPMTVFEWCGQTRYRCNRPWPQGGVCEWDTYDLHLMDEHVKSTHAVKKPVAPPMPTLFDANEELITRRQEPDTDAGEFSFAPEGKR
jgi:hypothetical protein